MNANEEDEGVRGAHAGNGTSHLSGSRLFFGMQLALHAARSSLFFGEKDCEEMNKCRICAEEIRQRLKECKLNF